MIVLFNCITTLNLLWPTPVYMAKKCHVTNCVVLFFDYLIPTATLSILPVKQKVLIKFKVNILTLSK